MSPWKRNIKKHSRSLYQAGKCANQSNMIFLELEKAVLVKKDATEEEVVMGRMLQNLQSEDKKEVEVGLNIFSENFIDMPIGFRDEALRRIEDLIIAHEYSEGSSFGKAFLSYKKFLINEKNSAQDGLQFFEKKISGLRHFADSIGAGSVKAQIVSEFVAEISASKAIPAIVPDPHDPLSAAMAGASIVLSSGKQVGSGAVVAAMAVLKF